VAIKARLTEHKLDNLYGGNLGSQATFRSVFEAIKVLGGV
jgi:hypothetical protein